jgi:carboxypeptidase C (cathepsin A)
MTAIRWRWLACTAILALLTRQDAIRADQPAAPDKTAPPATDKPAPPPAVSHRQVTVGGRKIAYTATASTIDLRNDKDEPIGRMFSVAYLQDGVTDARTRPVTFCFNGGPGSSTLWLHMASFGPMRVETTDAGTTPPAPYAIVDNDDTLLDKTDLVFVDAMGTGFSRILAKGEGKDFYGTDPDIEAFGQFIERWLSQNKRWNSPKFLLGESYGTTRAAGLLRRLQDKGTAFNGAVMVSSYLNAWDDFNGPAFATDLAYALYLPTMTATAWYHDKLEPKPEKLEPLLEEARRFALGDYLHAVVQGARLGAGERDAVAAQLHRLTAMPESFLREANLRIDPSRFEKELLRGERRTVGRLDARFLGIDHDAAGEYPESDAADDAFAAAFATSANAYLRDTLGYATEDLYRPTNYEEVGKDWDDRHKIGSRRFPMPDVAEDLRQAMSANTHLRVFMANGWFDFACPFFETEHSVSHMGLEPELEKNITWGYYPSGHMIYVHPPARKQMRQDLVRFYDEALGR